MAQAGHSKSENSMMVSGASVGPLLCTAVRAGPWSIGRVVYQS